MEVLFNVSLAELAYHLLNNGPLLTFHKRHNQHEQLLFIAIDRVEELPAPRVVEEVVQLFRSSAAHLRQVVPKRVVHVAQLGAERLKRIFFGLKTLLGASLHESYFRIIILE